MLLQTSKHLKRKIWKYWKFKKENLEILEHLFILVQKEFSVEFIRVYLDQFFSAIIVYRLE